MLRIFGFYQFKKHSAAQLIGKNIVRNMTGLPKTKSNFTKYDFFEFNNLFLAYELLNSEESKKYYFIKEEKRKACFIIGNIFAYERRELEILSCKNIAEFIFRKYQKDGLDFLKYLRGEFNIILIDNDSLYLMNDELGLSPMYIYKNSAGVFFCSEAEPIILQNKNNPVDYDSIAEFLVTGFIGNGKTFIKNLFNQHPGTTVLIDKKNFVQKKYASSHTFPNLNRLSLEKKSKFVNMLFAEAIKIRSPKKMIIQELSGGWDTRFVLANFLSLKAHPQAVTFRNTNESDIFIAKYIAQKFRIRHHIINEKRHNINRAFDFNFRLFKKRFFLGSRNIFFLKGKNKENTNLSTIFLSKIFTGLFGSEIFGYMSDTFMKILLKKPETSMLSVLDNFSPKLNYDKKSRLKMNKRAHNIFSLFLTQFVRSYWNVYINMQRDRIFDFFSLHPFADSKIVAVMDSLNYNANMNYKLYTKMFLQFSPAFLKIPYTYEDYRQTNILKNTFREDFAREQTVFKDHVFKNYDFLIFFKKNVFLKNINKLDYENLRKLYCVFYWFQVYSDSIESTPIILK